MSAEFGAFVLIYREVFDIYGNLFGVCFCVSTIHMFFRFLSFLGVF